MSDAYDLLWAKRLDHRRKVHLQGEKVTKFNGDLSCKECHPVNEEELTKFRNKGTTIIDNFIKWYRKMIEVDVEYSGVTISEIIKLVENYKEIKINEEEEEYEIDDKIYNILNCLFASWEYKQRPRKELTGTNIASQILATVITSEAFTRDISGEEEQLQEIEGLIKEMEEKIKRIKEDDEGNLFEKNKMESLYWHTWNERSKKHDNEHRLGKGIKTEDVSCPICDSPGDATKRKGIVQEFEKFWKWMKRFLKVKSYTGETTEAFEKIIKRDLVSTDDTMKEMEEEVLKIFKSLRYSEIPDMEDEKIWKITITMFGVSGNFKKSLEESENLLEEYIKSIENSKEGTSEEEEHNESDHDISITGGTSEIKGMMEKVNKRLDQENIKGETTIWREQESEGSEEEIFEERNSSEEYYTDEEIEEKPVIKEENKGKNPEISSTIQGKYGRWDSKSYSENYGMKNFGRTSSGTSYFGQSQFEEIYEESYRPKEQLNPRDAFSEEFLKELRNENSENNKNIKEKDINTGEIRPHWNLTQGSSKQKNRKFETTKPIVKLPGNNNKKQTINQIQNSTMAYQQFLQAVGINDAQFRQIMQTVQPTIAVNNHLPAGTRNIAKYDKFYGGNDEDPTEWAETMDRAFNANNVQNADKMAIAATFLRAEAAEWYEREKRNNVNVFGQWYTAGQNNNLRELLIANFASENKRSKWFQEYEMIRQGIGETIEDYANRLRKTLKRIDSTNTLPEGMKAQKFIKGLLPTYLMAVSAGNIATLEGAINTARQVEMTLQIGMTNVNNNVMSNIGISSLGTNPNPKVSEEEIDELTKKMDKMMLLFESQQQRGNNYNNYQRRNNNYQRNNNNQRNRNNDDWQRNVTCYNCGQRGHIATNCRNERNSNGQGDNNRNNGNNRNGNTNNRQNNERHLNYLNVSSEGEYTLSGNPSYDDYEIEEREMYPMETRARSNNRMNPITSNIQSESRKEDNLRTGNEWDQISAIRRQQVAVNENMNESIDTRTARQKGLDTRRKRTICKKCNQQGHFNRECPLLTEEERNKVRKPVRVGLRIPKGMDRIPIMKEVQPFNMEQHISNLPSGLTISQAASWIPGYRRDFFKAVRKGRDTNENTNYLGRSGENNNTTAMKCNGEIDGVPMDVIIDTGAANSMISKNLMERLAYNIGERSNKIFTTANGTREPSLGKIKNVELFLEGRPTKVDFEVVNSSKEILLLGIDWQQKVKAVIDVTEKNINIKGEEGFIEIPIETNIEENENDGDSDYEDEYEN